MENLSEYIRSVAFVLLLSAIGVMALPSGKYRGYAGLALGVILILALISPLRGLLQTDPDALLGRAGFSLDGAVLGAEARRREGESRALVMEKYREALLSQIKSVSESTRKYVYLSGAVEIDESEEGFGRLLSVSLSLRKYEGGGAGEGKNTPRPLIWIEKVRLNEEKDGKRDEPEDEDIKNIKKLISDFYNLSADNIYITSQNTNE